MASKRKGFLLKRQSNYEENEAKGKAWGGGLSPLSDRPYFNSTNQSVKRRNGYRLSKKQSILLPALHGVFTIFLTPLVQRFVITATSFNNLPSVGICVCLHGAFGAGTGGCVCFHSGD